MKEVIFSTGNVAKLREATEACAPFKINIIQQKLDIDEIQSHDPLKIAMEKARKAYSLILKPVVVNDSFWKIPALNGFPGGYMKDVIRWFSSEDYINLMRVKTDRRVCVTECIVYKDETIEKLITKEFWGAIAEKPYGVGNSIDQVAIFNGMTLGEHHQLGKLAFDPKDYIWNDFAEWFSNYDN